MQEQFITKNGEITYNPETRLYTVWDETYADTVGTTHYKEVAQAMLVTYVEKYLEETL